MHNISRLMKKYLPAFLVDAAKTAKRNYQTLKKCHSFLNEEAIIRKYLDRLPLSNRYCVDIAASDGITMSNTYFLYKEGWEGIAVEYDPVKFAALSKRYKKYTGVNLIKIKVIPENILSLLKACQCPVELSFLNFDIDSYDYFVLEQLLSE